MSENENNVAQEEMIPTEGTLLWFFYRKYYMMNEEAQQAQADKSAARHLQKLNDTLWKGYYGMEKTVYKYLLSTCGEPLKGTVKELAEKFDIEPMIMSGIIDGMNSSLKVEQDVKNLFEDTEVCLDIEPETLYRNMIDAKADWLYHLPEWDGILTAEKRKEIMAQVRAERREGTVVREIKVGRNDPCPCGSGKKYKHCCGRNAS